MEKPIINNLSLASKAGVSETLCARDLEEYRADLAGFCLTDAQEAELLGALWTIMGSFARMGFAVDACGLIFGEFNEASASLAGDGSIDHSTDMERPSQDGGKERAT